MREDSAKTRDRLARKLLSSPKLPGPGSIDSTLPNRCHCDRHPHLTPSSIMTSALLPRLAVRQSRWALQRRTASTTSQAANAASSGANKAKDGAQEVAGKAQQGLSRVSSSAGSAISGTASAASRAVSGIGGRTGAAVSFVQGIPATATVTEGVVTID